MSEKPYVYQEYPKELYKDGDRNAPHQTVKDAEEEKAARLDGFKMIDPKMEADSLEKLGLDAPAEDVPAKGKKGK